MSDPKRPRGEDEERNYHLGMANLCRERGFNELATSHLILAGAYPPVTGRWKH